MTSSATQTEGDSLRARLTRWAGSRAEPIAAILLVVAGWVLILAINRWHLGAPAVFLCMGWLSIVAAGRLLWLAAMRAGTELEGGADEVDEVGSQTRMVELEREKKALLKAIKEVEFDRELGKMSAEDADEIVRVYRARAIEILKLLDDGEEGAGAGAGQEAEVPIDQVIDREVRARLALAGVRPKVKKKKGEPEGNKEEDEAVKP